MATQKMMGRHTKKDFIDKLKNASTYQFKDSITHLIQDPNSLEDKSILTHLNAKIKHTEDGYEWDSIVLELGNDEDYVKLALPVILNSYDSPNFSWDKDPGVDKEGKARPLQKIEVKGQRPVKYDLHEDEYGFHLHLKVFRIAFDVKAGTTSVAPNEVAKVADAQLIFTNKRLEENGLSIIGETNKAFSKHGKPTQETKTEVQEVLNNTKTIEEVISSIENNDNTNEQLIDQSLTKDKKELEELLTKAKIKQAEIADKILAKQTLADNKRLVFVLSEKEKELAERDNLIAGKVEEIGKLNGTLIKKEEVFLLEKADLNNKIFNLEEIVEVKSKEVLENEDLYKEAQKENTEKEVIIKKQDIVIAEKENTILAKIQIIENKDISLADKDNQIATQIRQVDRLEKALTDSETTNKNIVERMQKIEQQLKDEKEQSAKKLAEQQKQFEDRLQAIEESNKKLKEQNDIILKENTIFKELTEMAIAKYKQATSIIKSLGAKLNTATDKKIVTNAIKQASDFDKAVKQVDSEKLDLEDKMSAVRALFAKGKAKPEDTNNNDDGTTSKTKPK